MSVVRFEEQAAGRCSLAGPLTFETVPQLYPQGRQRFSGSTIELDLSGVERSDSAGLALLVGWVRLARQQGGNITFHNIPGQLLGLARLGGVEELLAFQPGTI